MAGGVQFGRFCRYVRGRLGFNHGVVGAVCVSVTMSKIKQ